MNEESNDIAYVSRKVVFCFEAIQIEANPDIQATTETGITIQHAEHLHLHFYLIKSKNSHLKKIGREKDGAKKYYENF